VDTCKSFIYHGFKRIIIVNGHGGNSSSLDLAARRTILETDGLVTAFMWWEMLRVDPDFISSFRQSGFPGGCNHSCEIETSMYLHLCPEKVQMDKAADHNAWYNAGGAKGFEWADAFGGGPVKVVDWSSTFVGQGVVGQPTLATADKGRRILEEAASRLVEFVAEFQNRPYRPRVDHHSVPPSSPLPEV
jgi:creatinine amidohydrolase